MFSTISIGYIHKDVALNNNSLATSRFNNELGKLSAKRSPISYSSQDGIGLQNHISGILTIPVFGG